MLNKHLKERMKRRENQKSSTAKRSSKNMPIDVRFMLVSQTQLSHSEPLLFVFYSVLLFRLRCNSHHSRGFIMIFSPFLWLCLFYRLENTRFSLFGLDLLVRSRGNYISAYFIKRNFRFIQSDIECFRLWRSSDVKWCPWEFSSSSNKKRKQV